MARSLLIGCMLTCSPLLAFGDSLQTGEKVQDKNTVSLIESVSNKLKSMVTTTPSIEESAKETLVSLNEFNKKIKEIRKRSSSLTTGKSCVENQGSIFAQLAMGVRELSAHFDEGGDLKASLSAAISYNQSQQQLLSKLHANPERQASLTARYSDQAKDLERQLASISQWNSKLNKIEERVLNEQSYVTHECVLSETQELIKTTQELISELEGEIENIEGTIKRIIT